MRPSDEIRDYLLRNRFQTARVRGLSRLEIGAGEVHTALGYRNRLPAVCSVMGSKRLEKAGNVRLLKREGPHNGSSTRFLYELLSEDALSGNNPSSTDTKVADKVWIAAALLHREHSERHDFTVTEIVNRARAEGLAEASDSTIYQHAFLHCVANRTPQGGRYRMLYATGKLYRRLFREGDSYDGAREGSKITPQRSEIPELYRFLLDWYALEYVSRKQQASDQNSILALCGLGKEIWEDVKPDEYVRQLREGWE